MTGARGQPASVGRAAAVQRSGMSIPWQDDAVVIRAGGAGGDREQVHQGPLWRVVEWVREQPDRERLSVWLPERRARPFAFDQAEIRELLLRSDRPRGGIGFS